MHRRRCKKPPWRFWYCTPGVVLGSGHLTGLSASGITMSRDCALTAKSPGETISAAGGPMTRKALVIEDDTMLAELEAEVLRQIGFEPVLLAEGKNAVARVKELRPDVVLLDLMLPDASGYDICEALKL